jgi:hypothetical protein
MIFISKSGVSKYLYDYMGKKYDNPFINCSIKKDCDYLDFCKNFEYYMLLIPQKTKNGYKFGNIEWIGMTEYYKFDMSNIVFLLSTCDFSNDYKIEDYRKFREEYLNIGNTILLSRYSEDIKGEDRVFFVKSWENESEQRVNGVYKYQEYSECAANFNYILTIHKPKIIRKEKKNACLNIIGINKWEITKKHIQKHIDKLKLIHDDIDIFAVTYISSIPFGNVLIRHTKIREGYLHRDEVKKINMNMCIEDCFKKHKHNYKFCYIVEANALYIKLKESRTWEEYIKNNPIYITSDNTVNGEDISKMNIIKRKNIFELLYDGKVTDSNVHMNLKLNAESNIFSVSSIINIKASRSVFNPEERLKQTLIQLKCIREKVPNVKILFMELSDLTFRQIQKILKYADNICLFYKNDDAQFACNEYYNKNAGEYYILNYICNILVDKEFRSFCKFGGRYQFSSLYEFKNCDDSLGLKIIYPYSCSANFLPMIEPICFSVPKLLFNSFTKYLPEVKKLIYNYGRDMETSIYQVYIDINKFPFIHKKHLNIHGYIAGSGEFNCV